MNPDFLQIDAMRVQRLFERMAPAVAGNEADFIVREVSRRMAERLDYIKLAPRHALDAGSGDGADLPALRCRFPEAQWQAIDVAVPRLKRSRAAYMKGVSLFDTLGFALGYKRAAIDWFAADFGALPLPAQMLDLIWSNLALHWHAAPHRVLQEWGRVLNVGGLVLFSAFGPDTLKEVTQAFAASGQPSPVLPFTDMHDYGDMLVAAGFATPVVDAERLTLTYADRASLWRDVRALGGNALVERQRGLLGRKRAAQLDAALDAQKNSEGHYVLSFEIIYGHAWKGEPKKIADGRSIIRLEAKPKTRDK